MDKDILTEPVSRIARNAKIAEIAEAEKQSVHREMLDSAYSFSLCGMNTLKTVP